ncbi:phosphodiester glycosidase family protein [Echinicola marina]|uniref:phosphodiester glycosidase family protein n=1 Tax=Echinicola marina TaxID=2859768 RepID=UPI001CF61554|nr:phosphodiester glycosidase family protein [Echinicola marina]UCS92106.1 phosphodiester glycosidase family protein [Echinicola marina]
MMMRIYLLLMLISSGVTAQQVSTVKWNEADKEKIQSVEWETKKVAKGMRVKTASMRLFDAPQEIFMLEIDTAKAKVNYLVGMADYMEKTSVQAKANDAIAAINGSFFRNHAEPLGDSRHLVMVDGKVLARTDSAEFETRGTGAVVVFNNQVDITGWSREKEKGIAGKADHALTSGPLLMDNEKMVDLSGTPFVLKRHPRSVIAFNNGHLLLIVIGGRSENAAGMSLDEVQFFCDALGCDDILNLDGGGSSTLYVKGYDEDDIVNVPTDGSERAVKGIFYITKD